MISKLKEEFLQAQKSKDIVRLVQLMAELQHEMTARSVDRQKPADESSQWKEGKIKWPTIQEDQKTS